MAGVYQPPPARRNMLAANRHSTLRSSVDASEPDEEAPIVRALCCCTSVGDSWRCLLRHRRTALV